MIAQATNIHSRAYAESYLSSHGKDADETYREQYWNHFLLNAVMSKGKDSHLLEEGGGTCGVWQHLDFETYTSIDLSEEMVAAARHLYQDEPAKNIYQGSIKTVELADERFDAIVANAYGVYYRPELDALKKFAACLKSGGLIFIAIDPAITWKHRLCAPFASLIQLYRPYNRMTERDFLRMAQQAGLSIWITMDYTPAPGWTRKAYFLTKA